MHRTLSAMTPARKAFNQWARVLDMLVPVRAALVRLQQRGLSRGFEAWQVRALLLSEQ